MLITEKKGLPTVKVKAAPLQTATTQTREFILMASQALVIVEGVVRSARDLSSIRDGRRQAFGVAVELLTEVDIPGGAGGFLEVTLFIRDGELLPSHTVGEQVRWVISIEGNVYRNTASIRAQFVSELSEGAAGVQTTAPAVQAVPRAMVPGSSATRAEARTDEAAARKVAL